MPFLYLELLFSIAHIEKINEGELGHSRIQIRTQGVKYGRTGFRVLAEIGHSQIQNRPLNTTPP
jgi:hypothetical protein